MKKLTSLACVLFLLLTLFAVPSVAAAMDYTGDWVCLYVDFGDGTLQSSYEDQSLQELVFFTLQNDGSLTLTSWGEVQTGTWAVSDDGISMTVDDTAVPFVYQNNMLVTEEDGFAMYFARPQPEPTAAAADYTGDWVCMYVDLGDGIKLTEYEGVSLQETMYCTLSADGTVVLTTYGVEQTGTWQTTGDGISMSVSGLEVPFVYTDEQLINTEDGVIMYFTRANAKPKSGGFQDLVNIGQSAAPKSYQFAGTWQAVTYDVSGVFVDIATAFPDGLSITLAEDGTGSAQITADYAEQITWSETEDGISLGSSYLLYNPVWDAETETLTLCYAADVVKIGFQKADATTAPEPTQVPSVVEPTLAPAVTSTPEPTQAPAAAALPVAYTCNYFTAAFPEGWEQSEYGTYSGDQYDAVQYDLNDADGWSVSSVGIIASTEEVANYRSELDTLLDYAAEAGKDTLDELVIDGITFQGVVYGDYWITAEYIARIPEASITLSVIISEPDEIADILPDILSAIRFTFPIPDPPYSDPPLPEDGVSYTPSPASATIGSYDLEVSWLSAAGSIIAEDNYSAGIACVDDFVYVLTGDMLYTFTREGNTLVSAGSALDLMESYCFMNADVYGSLYITDGFYSGITLLEGNMDTYTMDGYLAMHPDGIWGLAFWSSYDVTKITFTSDGIATKPWALTDLADAEARQGRFSSIDFIAITEDAAFIAGTDSTTDYATRIVMYDFDGNELAVFGSDNWSDDDYIGSVTGIMQTSSCILVQDGFFANYLLFAPDGTFLGSVGCDDLLGTDNCWPMAMTASANGAVVVVSQEREDQSATELLIFEITGF